MLIWTLLAAALPVPPADERAIFAAAGFVRRGGAWHSDCDDPGTPSYTPGVIETFEDLNGDGRPEAVVTEGGTYCYGDTGAGFWLLSRNVGGQWKVMVQSQGMAEFLKTRGIANMPDISIGGPGFCFPVMRWNGNAYVENRFEYDGKRCKPPS
jgi:hypothetical protein